MKMHNILIAFIYALGMQSIQGMKKNLPKLREKTLLRPKVYSNIAQNSFEQIKNNYNIPDINAMEKNNDPELHNYTPEFFEKQFKDFQNEMLKNFKNMKQSIKYQNQSNEKELIENLTTEYNSTLKKASVEFGQAKGLIERYNRNKKSNPTITQRAKNFIEGWRTYFFGERTDKTQKRPYGTISHKKNRGTGYFEIKLKKGHYSSSNKKPYNGSLSKEMREGSFDINAIKELLKDPNNNIENYKKIYNTYMRKSTELEELKEFEDYIKYRERITEKIMKVINEDSDLKSQIDDYNETLKISNDEKIKPLVDTLISIKNRTGQHSIVYAFEGHLKASHARFYDKAATEKSKLEIMAARMHLLNENLKNNFDSIDIQNINKNPFYKIIKSNYYLAASGIGYNKQSKINKFKKNLYNSFESLTLPMSLEDLLDAIETHYQFTSSFGYSGIANIDTAQNLCLSVLFDYLIYRPSCTAEKLTQFYAFLHKMKQDKNYRKNKLDELIPSQKGDEEGILSKFKNLF